jgi:branched-subunit amino acid aminotransferase/4-amino-4-deoxychorismate lyase
MKSVIWNGQQLIKRVEKSVKEALLRVPDGVYTTMRTIANGQRIVELDAHVQRLSNI